MPCRPHGYPDVPAWVDLAVDWLAWTEVATGYPDDTFRPDLSISRAQVTNWLWKLADSPTGNPPHPYTDVPTWIEQAVRWFHANQIATGYPDDTFRPDLSISRAQVTNWLWKLADSPTGNPPHPYTDVPAWIEQAVRWFHANQIATGYPDDTFRPNLDISRAQVANWLWRLYYAHTRVLDDADRTPLADHLGGADAAATSETADEAVPDLLALVLATPSFQRR